MKLSDIIGDARVILSDADASEYQHSAQELVVYGNDFLLQLIQAKPDLLVNTVEITLVDGELQAIDRLTTNGLSQILKREDGRYVRQISRASLEAEFSSFPSGAAGPAVEWAPMGDDKWAFMVYPPSSAGQKLKARVFDIPAAIGAADVCPVSDIYRAAGAHYVAGRALMKNTNPQGAAKGQALISIAATLAGISK